MGFDSWIDGSHRYKLLSNQRSRYVLRRRPSDVTGGWEAEIGASDVMATIPADLLHASIADGIVNALETGAALTVAETISTGQNGAILPRDLVVKLDPESRADTLRNRLEATRAAADQAQKVAYLSKHPDGIRDAVALAEQRREEADALELQLQELEVNIRDQRQTPPPVSLVVDPGAVLAALANLKACSHLTPRQVRTDLHSVLRNFRIRIEGDVALWKVDVDLPGRGHLITLDGVSGTCPLATPGDWALDDRSLRRRRAFIAERLGAGDGLAGLVKQPPHSWPSWQHAAHAVVPVGRPYRHLVKAALVHPVRETGSSDFSGVMRGLRW
ncbi:hypothetical protein FTX61_21990 [Nitriliruptoraceae bacterium ZYF776]|nr:hypothetical protein [Profundirhabdus halotolerans]